MVKKILIRAAVLVGAIFFIVYCYIQMRSIFNSAITVQTANVYTVESKTEAECYILRNETVILSPVEKGCFNYLIKEGEKLSRKQPIAQVYSSEEDLAIHEEVAKINERINVLENSSLEKGYLKTNITKVDSQINEFVHLLHKATSMGEYNVAVYNRNDFLTLLNKRNLIVESETGYLDVIRMLEDEKSRLTASLSSPIATVVSSESGYFYSYVDGFEEQFNADILENLTVDRFFEIINNAQNSENADCVGKVVTNFEWYTLCITNKEQAVFYNSGDFYEITYPYSSGMSIKSKLSYKITQADRDEVILVFTTDNVPEGFNFLRRQKAEIKHSEFYGLKIPKDALRIVDGFEGVWVLSGNVISFRRCEKIYETDGYYLVSIDDKFKDENVKYRYLQIHDSVITGGKDLYDGKVIG